MLINGNEVKLKSYPLGSRALIGALTPSHDSGYGTYEFDVMSPEGVKVLTTSVMVKNLKKENLVEASQGAIEAAKMMATAHVDLINYIATGTVFAIGYDAEHELVKRIEDETGIQATGGGISVTRALDFMGAHKIIAYTPYNPIVYDSCAEYFKKAGFELIASKNLSFNNPADVNKVRPFKILADIVALREQNPDAEGVFCVGGCFRTLEIVDELEKIIGIPVVGTQQANMWNSLRMCKIPDTITGLGSLFEKKRI